MKRVRGSKEVTIHYFFKVKDITIVKSINSPTTKPKKLDGGIFKIFFSASKLSQP